MGRPKGQLSVVPPKPGDSLQLSIDAGIQAAGEAGLSARGLPGGFAAMDIRNGQVLGLGSFPTFAPSIFTKGKTTSEYPADSDDTTHRLTNRAIAASIHGRRSSRFTEMAG